MFPLMLKAVPETDELYRLKMSGVGRKKARPLGCPDSLLFLPLELILVPGWRSSDTGPRASSPRTPHSVPAASPSPVPCDPPSLGRKPWPPGSTQTIDALAGVGKCVLQAFSGGAGKRGCRRLEITVLNLSFSQDTTSA